KNFSQGNSTNKEVVIVGVFFLKIMLRFNAKITITNRF
ncbi:unnamed protein product, partial [marine sediment metagenome]